MITGLLLAILMVLVASDGFAQRIYDGTGRYIGRVDNDRYYDGSGRFIGRVENDRVYDGSGRNTGRIDQGRITSYERNQVYSYGPIQDIQMQQLRLFGSHIRGA